MTFDSRAVKPRTKIAERFYLTPEYRAWREAVIARAGRRCEAVNAGKRCAKAEPHHRMFADHKVERNDGGEDLDVANGQCLCGSHHTIKTASREPRGSVDKGGGAMPDIWSIGMKNRNGQIGRFFLHLA